MKQAKIMLSAIVLIAIVGGTLAFKATHFIFHVFYSYGTTTVLNGFPVPTATGCVVPVGLHYTTNGNPTTTIAARPATLLTISKSACFTPVIMAGAE